MGGVEEGVTAEEERRRWRKSPRQQMNVLEAPCSPMMTEKMVMMVAVIEMALIMKNNVIVMMTAMMVMMVKTMKIRKGEI